MRVSYVLPIRWRGDEALEELTGYLAGLPEWVELIVVDGSPVALFERHAAAWEGLGRHLPPDPAIEAPMGKVAGVLTGLREASHERVVVADDDVRYDERSLARVATLLGGADCVRPQNYFSELPWHARLDTARTLLNRALGGDFPGTLGVRRSTLRAAGGYDGDVIFENLELIRTVEAIGGEVVSPLDLFVVRRPPTTRHFLSQRVRQAYDDFAIPARMAAWLAVLPAALVAAAARRPKPVAVIAALLVAAAEIGRRRGGGGTVFPASSALLAPAWVFERGVCAWLAVRERIRHGGIPYGEGIVPRAASSPRRLRRRLASAKADQLVGPVAEGLATRGPAAT